MFLLLTLSIMIVGLEAEITICSLDLFLTEFSYNYLSLKLGFGSHLFVCNSVVDLIFTINRRFRLMQDWRKIDVFL